MNHGSLILKHRGGAKAHRPRVGVVWTVLVLAALGLILLSCLDHSYVRLARAQIAETIVPGA